MDVHLIGGGWARRPRPELYGGFIDGRSRLAGPTPRMLLVVMGTDEESLEYHEKYVHTLGLVGGHELEVERVAEGDAVRRGRAPRRGRRALRRRGPTPEYHASLRRPTPASARSSPRVCRMPGSPPALPSRAPTR